jgi:hypothetical protein
MTDSDPQKTSKHTNEEYCVYQAVDAKEIFVLLLGFQGAKTHMR